MSEPKKSDRPVAKAGEKTATIAEASYAIPKAWQHAWMIALGFGVIGLGATALALFGSGEAATRASFSYLFGFYVFLTIALGSLFFVLIQHLTSAGWSVTVRRTAEFFASALPVFILLFIPILFRSESLYPWTHPAEGGHEAGHEKAEEKKEGSIGLPFVKEAHAQELKDHPTPDADGHLDRPHPREHLNLPPKGEGAGGEAEHADPFEAEQAEILEHKQSGWLAKNFWMGRAAFYFAIWSLLGWFFFKNSTQQDKTKDPRLTLSSAKWAPLCTVAFGLTLTFAAFDWLMSLDPMWFSTIYGVYIFATSVVSSLAVIIIVTMSLREKAPFNKVITVEHFHDLGKLLFGFNVFWAYIGFSQMMLIWYAALPAETPFYHKRWETPSSIVVGNHSGDFWTNVSVAVLVGHFVIAFLFLISRNVKRRLPMLRLGAYWMVLMHMLDMYWFVLPNFEPNAKAAGFSVAWTDFTALIGIGGVYLAVVFYRMTKHSLIPTGDPRLPRAIAFVNA